MERKARPEGECHKKETELTKNEIPAYVGMNAMKFNWGTGIVIAFICFISFILYFVINMSFSPKYDQDLVVEDYYGETLTYQKDIDKLENSEKLKQNITYKKTEEGLLISFPEDLDITKITGNVFLYRPSNKQLDFDTAISLSKPYLLIPDNRLVDGRWNIKIDWQYNGISYLFKESLSY